MGNGLLAFSDRRFSLDRLFDDDEMVFYESDDDLVEQLKRHLSDDGLRRRMAENGWRKAHEHLNERKATQYIIDVLFRERLSHPYIWPTEPVVAP